MKEDFINAVKGGSILSVEWAPIQEMLGEEPQRELSCSLCEYGDIFPPKAGMPQSFTEEEIAEELKTMGEAYQMEPEKVEELLGENGREQVKGDIRVRKAADFVVENAVEE